MNLIAQWGVTALFVLVVAAALAHWLFGWGEIGDD